MYTGHDTLGEPEHRSMSLVLGDFIVLVSRMFLVLSDEFYGGRGFGEYSTMVIKLSKIMYFGSLAKTKLTVTSIICYIPM